MRHTSDYTRGEHIPIFHNGSFQLPVMRYTGLIDDKALSMLKASDAYFLRSKKQLEQRGTYLCYALKCLEFVTTEYVDSISPHVELLTYLKLSTIMSECQEHERAEFYLMKLLEISSRYGLAYMSFLAELSGAKQLMRNSPRLAVSYIDDKISKYEDLQLLEFADLFRLVRVESLMKYDCNGAIAVLDSVSEPASKAHGTIRAISSLYRSNILNYRNPFCRQDNRVVEAQQELDDNKAPAQLKAMALLLRFSMLLKSGRIDQSESVLTELNNFIATEHSQKWHAWKDDGTFEISIPISANGDLICDITCEVSWLSSNEFVILYYALTACKIMLKSPKSSAASKTLQYCKDLVDKEMSCVASLMPEHSAVRQRIEDLRNMILIYQAWCNLLNDDLTYQSRIEEILNVHNRSERTQMSAAVIQQILYYFGMSGQASALPELATYYYMLLKKKERDYTECDPNDAYSDIIFTTTPGYLKSISSIKEIDIMATLCLETLVGYRNPKTWRANSCSDGTETNNFELQALDEDATIFDFVNDSSNTIFQVTHWTVRSFIQHSDTAPHLKQNAEQQMEQISMSESGFALTTMLNYLLFRFNRNSLELREVYLERTLLSVKSSLTLPSQKAINTYVLKYLLGELQEQPGHHLFQEISVRLQFLNGE